jgi:hypothetical protein
MSPDATVITFCPLRHTAAQKERFAALTVELASALTFLVIAPLAASSSGISSCIVGAQMASRSDKFQH